jgi:hypothetical protein
MTHYTSSTKCDGGMRELKLRLATEELERCRIESERLWSMRRARPNTSLEQTRDR